MSCALHPDGLSRRKGVSGRRGLTLIETLVAIAVVMVFFVGAVMAFLEIVRTKEATQARLDAVANARHALEAMSLELKRARLLPEDTSNTQSFEEFFRGDTIFQAAGDRADSDQDGRVDEENFDGLDNDADYSVIDDRHVRIPLPTGTGSYYERWKYRQRPDLDDARIDEDTRFSSSTVEFQTFPRAGGLPERRVTFSSGTDPDSGDPNAVIMRVEESDPDAGIFQPATVAAVAHNVLSFTALYWDAEETTASQPSSAWTPYWSSSERLANRNTAAVVPASVYLSVTVYSGSQPLSTIPAGAALETVTLHTVVNVESVLADPRYDTFFRQPAQVFP